MSSFIIYLTCPSYQFEYSNIFRTHSKIHLNSIAYSVTTVWDLPSPLSRVSRVMMMVSEINIPSMYIILIKTKGDISRGGCTVRGQRIVLGQLIEDTAASLRVIVLWVNDLLRLGLLGSSVLELLLLGCRGLLGLLRLVATRQLVLLVLLLLLLRGGRIVQSLLLLVVVLGARWALLSRVGDIGGNGSSHSRTLRSLRLDQLLASGRLLLLWLWATQFVGGVQLLRLLVFLVLLLLRLETLRSRTGPLLLLLRTSDLPWRRKRDREIVEINI